MRNKSFLFILCIGLGILLLSCQKNEATFGVCEICFESNGGYGSMGKQLLIKDKVQSLKSNTFLRQGYGFASWNTAPDGSGESYLDEANISISQNVVLYAQWRPGVYTLKFDANGGSGMMYNMQFEQDVPQVLPYNTFSINAFVFKCWNTEADGSGTQYEDGEQLMLSQDMTLYAQWEPMSNIVLTYQINNVTFVMKPVVGGDFIRGAQNADQGVANYDAMALSDEGPLHTIHIDDFFMAEAEVTQALWHAVMGTWPTTPPSATYGMGDDFPIYNVSYHDVLLFITKLNVLLHLTGQISEIQNFRLPTEAEWEYAARGGCYLSQYIYSGSGALSSVGWNGDNTTHPVKQKLANAVGLYDMSGNVWEWCSDWYDTYSSQFDNPTGPSSGNEKVNRGGSYCSPIAQCRVSARFRNGTDYTSCSGGFRLCLNKCIYNN